MSCNGCQALRGPLVTLTSSVTITATGISVQELLRVTVPPMDDPVELVGIIRPASLLTATVVAMQVGLYPVGGATLNALDYDQKANYPFTDVNQAGLMTRLSAWIDTPGEYMLGATKSAGNGQAVANVLARTRLWWRR